MTNDCHCLGELLDGHIMPIYRAKYDMLYTVHSYAHVHLAACYGCQKQLFRLTGETMSMSITCQTMESQSTLFVVAIFWTNAWNGMSAGRDMYRCT